MIGGIEHRSFVAIRFVCLITNGDCSELGVGDSAGAPAVKVLSSCIKYRLKYKGIVVMIIALLRIFVRT